MLAHCADDGDNKPGSPGRARKKPLKPSRGESRIDPVEPVVTNSCAFLLAHEAAGATGIRLSLRPPFSRGTNALANVGRNAPRREMTKAYLDFRRGADRRAARRPMQEGDRYKCAEP